MNKLLFNEGGQPVYLDDLETLQTEPAEQLKMLLKALGVGTAMFLLKEFAAKSLPSQDGKTYYGIYRNWLVKDGEIYELPDTGMAIESGDTLYVGLKTAESDERNFDDGQSHACLETTTAYYSTVKTDDSMVDVKSLKSLWEIVAPVIKQFMPVEEYKTLNVTFKNGFTGTVEYKDVGDAYRVRVNIESKADSWEDESMKLFTMNSELDVLHFNDFYANIATPVNIWPTPVHGWFLCYAGSVSLDGVDRSKYAPKNCYIYTIFDTPKHSINYGNR